MLNPLLIY